MRFLPVFLAILPVMVSSVSAEDIVLSGKITDVVLYPDGATITRNMPFQADAGAHHLIVTGIPANGFHTMPRIVVTGAKMGAVTMRESYVPPSDAPVPPALEAARDVVEAVKHEIRNVKDHVAAIRLEKEAVVARVGFLGQIGEGDKLANSDLAMLRDLSRMIGEETLAARQSGQKAEIAARAFDGALSDLQEDLEVAEKRVAAMVPEKFESGYISVDVSSDGPIDGMLSIRYLTADAAWAPAYDVRLTTEGEAATVVFDRGAMISQSTGENWAGVNLQLSTLRPSEQTAPSPIYTDHRRIGNPAPVSPVMRSMMEAPMAELVVMDHAEMGVDFNGLSVTYTYGPQIDVASGADMIRVALGSLTTSAEVYAQAVPMSDETAFMMADFTNDTGEIILPSIENALYLNGKFVGKQPIDRLIPAEGKGELSFGPIEGLRLSRTVLTRNEGDRGFVSKSNEITELVGIKVENLTDQTWNMRLLDRVPYSEQEDLTISWRATPAATETDFEGRRGILQWQFPIAAKGEQEITLAQEITWPDGKILR